MLYIVARYCLQFCCRTISRGSLARIGGAGYVSLSLRALPMLLISTSPNNIYKSCECVARLKFFVHVCSITTRRLKTQSRCRRHALGIDLDGIDLRMKREGNRVDNRYIQGTIARRKETIHATAEPASYSPWLTRPLLSVDLGSSPRVVRVNRGTPGNRVPGSC